MKILFVCNGNVGRSQMAEAIFNKIAEGRHESFSTGTRVIDLDGSNREGQKLKDNQSAENVLIALKEIGIDASENERNQLTPENLDNADVIIVMASEDTIPEYLKENSKVEYWNIPDPYSLSLEATREIRDQISKMVTELLNKIKIGEIRNR